jgi:hypothetical protein
MSAWVSAWMSARMSAWMSACMSAWMSACYLIMNICFKMVNKHIGAGLIYTYLKLSRTIFGIKVHTIYAHHTIKGPMYGMSILPKTIHLNKLEKQACLKLHMYSPFMLLF